MQPQQSWLQPREPVWLHKNQQFLKGVIKEISKDIVTCLLQSGEPIKLKRHDVYHRNPLPFDQSRTDLMESDVINQPEILQHLKLRFQTRKIYTYVQNTLIAINPYSPIPELYTDTLKDYYIHNFIESTSNVKQHEPHLYSITAQMVKSLFQDHRNQAIIISGESGAGKTEANKQCLRFLARYFKHINAQSTKQDNIERTIMLSNPILQAFGNSKTIRNNNSSRFGKYLSIMVDSRTREIKHAEIFNYLLEKSRIISRSKQQQNFHVFYQFLIKTTKSEKLKYGLVNADTKNQMTFQDFAYTCNDAQAEYMAHPDVSFQKIKQSLTILPDPRSYDYLCRILSAILHLGNLQPCEDDNLEYCEILPASTFETVCQLLEIDRKYLFESLTSYSIKIGGEDLIKSFSKREVQELIHSLSKTLYERLFQWIINQINLTTKSADIGNKNLISLGFLDIYGFEVLKSNSLEQLFINYTNERLHQIYLHKIFKLEKEHFVAEKLESKFKQVNFEDNIKVLELIDYDNLSIFNLLDQWSAVASPDESTLITKIRFNHKKHEKFPVSNLNLLSTQFMIKHTPQEIQYNVAGFKQKNKDLLREEIKITMRSSSLRALQAMFTEAKAETEPDMKSHRVRKYLSSKFRKEMNELVNGLLEKSEKHFIRCIKSNGNKRVMEVEEEIVYSQIKYLGILDTIKIKKMGYCVKIKYEDIDRKYPWVVRKNILRQAGNGEVIAAIKKFMPRFNEEDMLFGATRLFFKDYAYTTLIKRYFKQLGFLNERAHMITSFFVGVSYRKKRDRKIRNKKTVLRYFRGFLEAKKIRTKLNNLVVVQREIRKFITSRKQVKKINSVLTLQAYIKRNIQTKMKAKRLNLINKAICRFKFLVFRKKIRSRLVSQYIVEKVIYEKFWRQLRSKNLKILSAYLNAFKVKVQRKDKIHIALVNQKNAIEGRSLNAIEEYCLSFAEHLNFLRRKSQIMMLQSNIKTYIVRKKYENLRNKVILIQRAVRQYLFKKKGAKAMFQATYKTYDDDLKSQNKLVQKKLYDSQNSFADQMNSAVKRFLNKFKQKISLIYYVIDFQNFIDISMVYPNDSWIANYLEIFQEGLQKNDPIQYLSVGQTFTVASSTSKMYLWGMHESIKNLNHEGISQVKTKMPVQFFQINKNKLNFSYVKSQDEKKAQSKTLKISSTVAKDYNLQNGKLYQYQPNKLSLIKGIPQPERIVEISCGSAHTILRSSSRKVYTFGHGRQGQLGHSVFSSQQKPRVVKFFQQIKTAYPIQVSASFTCSLVLLSSRKLFWFGKNGTISQTSSPSLFQPKSKCEIFNSTDFCIGRVISSWSRTMSVIGVTIVCYNGKFQNNLSLRNKTTDVLFSKWQQSGIHNINPPVIPSISDHLQQCHIKIKSKKISIQPESKKTLQEMEEKARSISSLASALDSATHRNSIGTEFSFANTQRNSIFK